MRRLRVALVCAAILCMAACSVGAILQPTKDPSQFYVLTPIDASARGVPITYSGTGGARELEIGRRVVARDHRESRNASSRLARALARRQGRDSPLRQHLSEWRRCPLPRPAQLEGKGWRSEGSDSASYNDRTLKCAATLSSTCNSDKKPSCPPTTFTSGRSGASGQIRMVGCCTIEPRKAAPSSSRCDTLSAK